MLWPARPKPLPDETPASWFARVAQANGHRSLELARVLSSQSLPIQQVNAELPTSFSLRILDKGLPDFDLLDVLAKPTGVSAGVIHEMLRMAAQIEELNNLVLATTDVAWRFCPRCLQDDPVPYFRLDWRKGWYLLCSAHLVWLEDRCKHCEADVDLELHGPDSNSLAVCTNCGGSLGCQAAGQNTSDVSERVNCLNRQRRFQACLLGASPPMSIPCKAGSN